MTSISVVLLNWNGVNHLKTYLPKVIEHTSHQAEVVLIDNASEDDSVTWVKSEFPQVKIVQNNKNYGFAGGYNEGLKSVDADLLVLMNTDVLPAQGYLQPIIKLFEENAEMAACQPKILALENPGYFEYAGAGGGYMDKDGYTFCRGRIFDTIEKDEGQYDDTHQVFWASGACLFIRKKSFDEAGGFDADFFAHMEEIDLCWRLKNAGNQIWYCGDSVVYHLGGGTLNYQSNHKSFLNFRNNLFLIYKNYRGVSLPPKLFKRLLLDGIAAIRFLFKGRPTMLWVVLKAHLAFYAKLGTMRKKRRSMLIQNRNTAGLYPKSLVWGYFVKRIRFFSEL